MTNPYETPQSTLDTPIPPEETDQEKFYSPKGRLGRFSYLALGAVTGIAFSVFLYGMLFMFFGTDLVTGMLTGDVDSTTAIFASPFTFALMALYIVFIVLTIILAIKRLHDINMSGWWALLILPTMGLFMFFLMFKSGTPTANRFGPPRITKTWEKVVGWIYVVLGIFYLIGIFAAILVPILTH